jgi:hypothetical protein
MWLQEHGQSMLREEMEILRREEKWKVVNCMIYTWMSIRQSNKIELDELL